MSSTATPLPPTSPDPSSVAPQKRPALTQEQFSKLALLLQHLNADSLTLPDNVKDVKDSQKKRLKGNKDPKSWVGQPLQGNGQSPLSDTEKCWLSSEQVQRFLRATKWDLPSAFARCEETIVWRREFGVEDINNDASMVEEESRTGKEIILGWDNQKRPCLYMFPGRQNTKQSHRQIQFVVWTLERTVDLMGPHVENLCLLIDFGAGEKGGGQPTSLGQAKKVLDILQNYYCERLGRAVCINVPTIFWGFYRLVSPFVDPVTKDKIRFNPDVRTLIPPSQLEKENFKGDYDFVYKHEETYKFVDEMCRKRREEQFTRWKQFGNGKCGLSEFIIRGGMEEAREAEEAAEAAAAQKPGAGAPGSVLAAGNSMPATPASTRSSRAPSTISQGYQEPPEAADAPDWEEPPSTATSSIHTTSPTMNRNASNSISGLPPTVEEGNFEGIPTGTRPRGDSADSFVTSREELGTSVPKTANGHAATEHGQTIDGISTGIQGLVIKEDGSMGAP